jgi:hypothetical protein
MLVWGGGWVIRGGGDQIFLSLVMTSCSHLSPVTDCIGCSRLESQAGFCLRFERALS